MIAKKIGSVILSVAVIVLSFCSCRGDDDPQLADYYDLISQAEMEQNGHEKVLEKYCSGTSVAFENTDGTRTLYVYSSPICYRDDEENLRVINLSLKELDDSQDYQYTVQDSDIMPYFPAVLDRDHGVAVEDVLNMSLKFDSDFTAEGVKSIRQNFIQQEKEAIVYKNAVFEGSELNLFPTNVGVNFELQLSEKPETNYFDVWLSLSKDYAYLQPMPAGYIAVLDNRVESTPGNVLGVIQAPMIRSTDGKISINTTLSIEEQDENKGYRIRLTLDEPAVENGGNVFWCIELRREKQSDNAIYSNFPFWNQSFLTNYAVIGNSEHFGVGRVMTRFDVAKNFGLKSEEVVSARYDTYLIDQTDPNLQYDAYYINGEWCAIYGNWKSNYQTGDLASFAVADGHQLTWDITQAVKQWCVDRDRKGELEQFGLMLESSQEDLEAYGILLSHDNTLYRSRTVIQLSK